MIFAHFLLKEANEVNQFLIACEDTHEACLVDAGALDSRIVPFLQQHGLRLTKILITHTHWDHVDGLPAVLQTFPDAVPFAFEQEVKGIATNTLVHGATFGIGYLEGRIVHTPGHTPDGISWILPGMAFTGDALFSGSVGGTSSPELARQQLDAIRQHLFTLPDDTEIHVGHGPSSTIGIERKYNPFFV